MFLGDAFVYGFSMQIVGECWWRYLVMYNTVITNATCMVFSHIALHKIWVELPTLLTTKHTADPKQTQNEAQCKQQFLPKTPSASLKPAFFEQIIWHLQSKFGSYLYKTPHNTSPKHNWLINSKPQRPLSCRKIKRGQQTLPQPILQKNAIRKVNLQKTAKFSVACQYLKKVAFELEVISKLRPSASNGDFRRYLYEAPIFSMPCP